MNDKIKQLEHLKSRLKKAYSLPKSEQQKWKKEIEKIENQIAKLESELGIFTPEKAEKLLLNTVKQIAEKLCWKDLNLQEVYKKHPFLKEKEEEAEKRVDNAFKQGCLTALQNALNEYVQVILEINSVVNDVDIKILEQIGFDLLDPDSEEAQKLNELFPD